jgi:hypothetical protein
MTNKDLISQYVDTGLELPEYQVMKLSNQDMKTYIRKRWIAFQQQRYSKLRDYEIKLLTQDQRFQYVLWLREWGHDIRTEVNKFLTPEQHFQIAMKTSIFVPYDSLKLFTQEQIFEYLMKRLEKDYKVGPEEVGLLTPEQQKIIKDKYRPIYAHLH